MSTADDTTGASAGSDPAKNWSGTQGATWVALNDLLDATLAPVAAALVEAVAARQPARVLDVGCGPGTTSYLLGERLGVGVEVIGADVAPVMIEAAEALRPGGGATNVRFLVADAQTHRFQGEPFAALASRFGVMFFPDPVAAFANLRRATRSGGTLDFFAWRGPEDNPFMHLGVRGVAHLLPLPPADLTAPGPFGLADADRGRRLLVEAGWQDVAFTPVDLPCTLPTAELERYVRNIGPVGRALQASALGPDEEQVVIDAALAGMAPLVDGDTVRYPAACWHITARA